MKQASNDKTVPAIIAIVLIALAIILYWRSDYTATPEAGKSLETWAIITFIAGLAVGGYALFSSKPPKRGV